MNPLEQYNSIIDYWQKNPPVKGGEVHHIIPRSCGGCDKKWNKVRMPTLEHIRCHRLLCEIYPIGEEHKAMATAYDFMLTTRDGVKVSEEEAARARDEASKAKRGRKTFLGHHHSNESKEKIREGNKGKTLSASTRSLISKAAKKRKWTEERRKVHAERMKGNKFGKGNSGNSHPCSEETRKKISKTLTGRVGANKGVPKKEETKRKISATLTGRKTGPRSEEVKRKIAEGQKARWARKKQLSA